MKKSIIMDILNNNRSIKRYVKNYQQFYHYRGKE